MSNNINTVVIAKSDGFSINVEKLNSLRLLEDSFPEISILDERWANMQPRVESHARIFPRFLWWSGEGSGYTVDVLTEQVLPLFNGSADIVLAYESGDFEGYRLRDHKVTRHNVRFELDDEEV